MTYIDYDALASELLRGGYYPMVKRPGWAHKDGVLMWFGTVIWSRMLSGGKS